MPLLGTNMQVTSVLLNNDPLEKECRTNFRYKSIFDGGALRCAYNTIATEKKVLTFQKLNLETLIPLCVRLITSTYSSDQKSWLLQFLTSAVSKTVCDVGAVVQSFGKLLCSSSVDEIKSFPKPCVHFL